MANLHPGSHGAEVQHLQEALVAQGYYVGAVDGQYGKKLEAAVGYFQSCNSLTIDGVAGPQVLGLLGITHAGAAAAVTMTLPVADARISNNDYSIEVHATAEGDVRVVAWFRTGHEETHAEATVHVAANGTATATIPIPESVRQTEAEVHVTALAYAGGHTEPADHKASHFWVDRL